MEDTDNYPPILYLHDQLGPSISNFSPVAAINCYGDTFVLDSNGIMYFITKTATRICATKGSGEGQLLNPTSLSISYEVKRIFVVDSGNHRINLYDFSGNFISTFGKFGSGDGELKDPKGIAISIFQSTVLIADTGNKRVQLFTLEGHFKSIFPGQFQSPKAICTKENNVYIADIGCVLVYSNVGVYKRTIGSPGTGYGQFSNPCGLTFSEYLYVVDEKCIQRFKNNGECVGKYKGELQSPQSIKITTNGIFIIADKTTKRVFMYKLY